MNIIRQLRRQANLTQQDLAAKASTSQSAIAAYEADRKSPTLRTLKKFASSLDLELSITFVPRLTREDRRSLAFHGAIARLLRKSPSTAIRRARHSLVKLGKLHPHAQSAFTRWDALLGQPIEGIIERILDPGMTAREMRHVSPFSGLLSGAERTRILQELRAERER